MENDMPLEEQDRPLNEVANRLFDEAVRQYGATAMWYMRPKPTLRGAEGVARALEDNGDLAATRLAAELRRACRDAT